MELKKKLEKLKGDKSFDEFISEMLTGNGTIVIIPPKASPIIVKNIKIRIEPNVIIMWRGDVPYEKAEHICHFCLK